MASLPFQALDEGLPVRMADTPTDRSATASYWMPCRQRWLKPRADIPYPFEMRRKVNGKWKYRLPTPAEVCERSSTDQWPMRS
jgi:hypothetical protein